MSKQFPRGEGAMRDERGGGERIIPNSVLFNKVVAVRGGVACPLCRRDAPLLDYKNVLLLQKFTSEGGRILPSRVTGVCRKHQRKLSQCVKLARTVAFLPFVVK